MAKLWLRIAFTFFVPSRTFRHTVDATILSRHSRAFQHTASPDRIAWRVKDPEHSRREQVEPVGATMIARQSLVTSALQTRVFICPTIISH
jgi:hypothetical protein